MKLPLAWPKRALLAPAAALLGSASQAGETEKPWELLGFSHVVALLAVSQARGGDLLLSPSFAESRWLGRAGAVCVLGFRELYYFFLSF